MNEDPLIHPGEYIAYFPELGKTLGSTDRAIVLQYLWYRRDRTTGRAVLPLDELAEKTGITYATVRRVTDWLIKNGHLVKHRASTWDPTSTWEIRWNDGAAQSGHHVVPNLSSSQVRKVSNTQVRNLSNTSSKNPEEQSENTPIVPSGFEEFWAAYPRKAGSLPAARAAWLEAKKKLEPVDIIAAAKRHADDPNRVDRYTVAPAKWLTEERWNNDPEPSRAETRSSDPQADLARAEMQKALARTNQTPNPTMIGTRP